MMQAPRSESRLAPFLKAHQCKRCTACDADTVAPQYECPGCKKRYVPTHTSLRGGAYHITGADMDSFFDLYSYDIYDAQIPWDLTEIRKDLTHSQLMVDFDFKYTAADNSRKWGDAFLDALVSLLGKSILEFVNVDPTTDLYVSRRKSPYKVPNDILQRYKDGIHLHAPDVILCPIVAQSIRDRFLEQVEAIPELDLSAWVDDANWSTIYDKGASTTGNVMIYGSTKMSSDTASRGRVSDPHPYKIFKRYSLDGHSKEYVGIERDIPKLLSIRLKSAIPSPMTEQGTELMAQQQTHSVAAQSTGTVDRPHAGPTGGLSIDLEFPDVCKLVAALNPRRACNYDEWVQVGFCLYNIASQKNNPDVMNKYFDVWDNFSQQWPNYKQSDVRAKWNSSKMRYERDRKLTIRTLRWWVKSDNPSKYDEIVQQSKIEQTYQSFKKSLSFGLSDAALADIMYSMCKDEFVHVGDKTNKGWYRFVQSFWKPMDSNIDLHKKLYDQLRILLFDFKARLQEDLAKMSRLQSDLSKVQSDVASNDEAAPTIDNLTKEEDSLESKKEIISKMIGSLCEYHKKNSIINESIRMFHQDNFYEQLDDRRFIVAFTNGVYDGVRNAFREGQPEDYLTLTTKYPYKFYNTYDKAEMDDMTKDLWNFLNSVQPQQDVRDYMLTIMAKAFFGDNTDQHFYTFTGSGGNGKGKFGKQNEYTFGDYFCNGNITIFTKDRPSSNQAQADFFNLKGRRILGVAEPENRDKLRAGMLKFMTGGDKIRCRSLFETHEIEYDPQFTVVMQCNDLPEIESNDGGIWRRVIAVQFPSKFVEDPNPANPLEFKADPLLNSKLFEWRERYACILIHYFVHNHCTSNKLAKAPCPMCKGTKPLANLKNPPDAIKQQTREYQYKNDFISQFMADMYEVTDDDGDSVQTADMYSRFKVWYSENMSRGKAINKSEFLTQMERFIRRRYENVDGKSSFRGVRIKPVEVKETPELFEQTDEFVGHDE